MYMPAGGFIRGETRFKDQHSGAVGGCPRFINIISIVSEAAQREAESLAKVGYRR